MDGILDIPAGRQIDGQDDIRRRLQAVLDAVIETGLAADGVAGLNAVLRAVKLKADLAGLLDRPARRRRQTAEVGDEVLRCAPPDSAAPADTDAVPGGVDDPAPVVAPAKGAEAMPPLAVDPPETIPVAADDPACPPVRVYRGVLRGGERKAAAVRRRFEAHGWGGGGRVGNLTDRSQASAEGPEALALLRGRAWLGVGSGETVELGAGDVCVLPAGAGPHCLEATGDLAVVTTHPDGADPPRLDPLGRPWPGG